MKNIYNYLINNVKEKYVVYEIINNYLSITLNEYINMYNEKFFNILYEFNAAHFELWLMNNIGFESIIFKYYKDKKINYKTFKNEIQ